MYEVIRRFELGDFVRIDKVQYSSSIEYYHRKVDHVFKFPIAERPTAIYAKPKEVIIDGERYVKAPEITKMKVAVFTLYNILRDTSDTSTETYRLDRWE